MTKQEILSTLKSLKPQYEKDGFEILGIFGSYSRDMQTENSDIDILINTTNEFVEKYRGFKAFSKLDEIKNEFKQIFHTEIDFVDKQGLLQRNNNYILNKAIYV